MVLASLDALASRQQADMPPGLAHAVVHRSRPALKQAARRLQLAWQRASNAQADPLLGGFVATVLHDLALRVGDAPAAVRWRARAGCVRSARVAGPLAWPPLGALEEPSPVSAHEALPASLAGVAPFAHPAELRAVVADGCDIDVGGTSPLRGLRAVVVDVDSPRAQLVRVAFTSSSAARVELGGAPLLRRPYSAGVGPVTVLATARVSKGRVRLVARVAQKGDGDRIRIQLWGEDGTPLRSRAPQPGQAAAGTASEAREVRLVPATERNEDRVLGAAALLALGRAREASPLFDSPAAAEIATSPVADLVRMRAIQAAREIPETQTLLRVEGIAHRVLSACPSCWEARIASAAATRARKGAATGTMAALRELGATPQGGGWWAEAGPVELAFAAHRAHRAGLLDLARQSYLALAKRAAGAALLADLDAAIHHRVGADQVQAACAGGTSRAGARCLQARIAHGDFEKARAELRRLRALRGSPDVHRSVELGLLLMHGELGQALRVLDAMPPGRRSLMALGVGVEPSMLAAARERFQRYRLEAADAPYAYEPLARLLGLAEDRSLRFAEKGRELVARDRAEAFLPGAATAVLRRVERYRLEQTGLLHVVLYDLRRVSGTTDVAAGAWGGMPTVEGRSSTRTLWRRIHKRDGRVLDPDPRARGRQAHTELSQLETGDYVEMLATGWALPGEGGQLTVDTPDLLPERTSVREAQIELERPAAIDLAMWSHALLGQGITTSHEGTVRTRWLLRDQPPRRMESGVPALEARVGLSFGSSGSWDRIARALGDRFRALDERDPFMGRWVQEALGGEPLSDRQKIARIVAAVGKAVRKADPGALSDFSATLGGGPQRETARTILEQGSGSRTWVVFRALREIGLTGQIAVSETEPFSAAPGFPPHVGRFRHPLVRVECEGQTLWIDADVDGPPLPPGRVSPELRGREALLPSGELVRVEGEIGVEQDEIDIRLEVAENGDARGSFSALIHGRPAQKLAEALEVTVGSTRERLLRNVVLGWMPWADVRELELSSDAGSWQLSLRARITVVGYAQPEGRDRALWSLPGIEAVHAVHPQPRAKTLSARYAAHAGRTTALAIDEPLLFHVRRRVELPQGARVLRAPDRLRVQSERIRAERSVAVEGTVIEEHFRLNLPAGTVAAEQFEPFAATLQRIDDGFLHATRVSLGR